MATVKRDGIFSPTIAIAPESSERSSWADLYRANAAETLATMKAEERDALARMRMHLSALAEAQAGERAQTEALKVQKVGQWSHV